MNQFTELELTPTELELIDGGDWWQVAHAFVGTIATAGAVVGAMTGNFGAASVLTTTAIDQFRQL